MLNPYHMVFVNIILSLVISILLLTYKYVYPKKDVNNFVLIFLISLLPIISIFRSGIYESGDFNVHVYRNIAFYSSLSEGQWFPSWARDLNAYYGYPTFLIEGPLGDYIPAFFHFIKFSFVTSFKLLLAITYIFSGIGAYLWIKKDWGKKAATVGAIFYLYAPFHLVDLHFRVSPGDMLAFMFLPFLLFSSQSLLKTRKKRYFILNVISCAGLLLSHPIALVGISFSVAYLLFVVIRDKTKKSSIFILVLSILMGFTITSFFWLQLILESKYRLSSILKSDISFESPLLYIFSRYRYGFLFQGPQGELTFNFGYIQWLTVILSLPILIKVKITKWKFKTLIFFLSSFFFIFIMIFPFTKPLWDVLPLFNQLEFSYRIIFIIVPITAMIGAILSNLINKQALYISLGVVAIGSTILNWGHRRVIPEMNDSSLIYMLPGSTFSGEGGKAAAPKWVDPKKPFQGITPNSPITTLSGEFIFKQVLRTSTKHVYVINSKTESVIKENTYFYPGWNAYLDKKLLLIQYQHPKHPGVIIAKIPKGLHLFELEFRDTTIRLLAKIISVLSLVFTLLILVNKKLWK